MKVCLCSIPVEGVGEKPSRLRSEGPLGVLPKIAIVSLVKWMERNGRESDVCKFYDIDMLLPSDADIRKFFIEHQPEVVGLSAVVSSSYGQVMRISSIIREVCPDAWIVVGGSIADSAAVLLSKTETDVCVKGNGEIAWVNFLNYVEKYKREWNYEALGKIRGLCYFNDAKELVFNGLEEAIPAEDLPFPDYDLLLSGLQDQPEAINNYFRDALQSKWFSFDERALETHRLPRVAHIPVSKGCVARCTFCQRSFKGYWVPSIGTFEEHLIELKERFNVGFINIADENFGSDKSHAYEVARIMKKHDMLWVATGIRCTSVTYDDIKFFKENNCSALQFGIESGSQKILDMMDKVFTTDNVNTALDNCLELSIYSPLALMLGMPGETDETAMETGAFIGERAALLETHPEDMGYDLYYAIAFPGTPLYEYGQLTGVIGKTIDEEEQYLKNVSNASIFKRYYVNLNGAPTKDVIFWDWLARLEASRVYHQKKSSLSSRNSKFAEILIKNLEQEKKINPNVGLKYSAIKFTTITQFLDKRIIGNPLIDKIPRAILYPLLKYLVYFEFIIQGILPSNNKHNIFREKKVKAVSRIDDSLLKKLNIKKKRSTLRTVVTQMKKMGTVLDS
ncbi:MAG: B12-binding domain-containing radical SAM protein [Nitrospinae bacterium]|nr:B12-binding domain-containing radical SAM protein [Nitrospinota bacterium]